MTFVIRQFDENQTIGEMLHAIRKAANRTLGEMSTATKIHKDILKAFEENAYDRLPEPIYTKRFLRTYVKTLGGDVTYFLERYEAECGSCALPHIARMPARARFGQFLVASRLLKIAALLAIALALVGYLGFEWRQIRRPPSLAVEAPLEGFATRDASVHVRGKTDTAANVKVNGVPVLTKRDGSFDTDVLLERGVNVITVEGMKRYSASAIIYRRVLLESGD